MRIGGHVPGAVYNTYIVYTICLVYTSPACNVLRLAMVPINICTICAMQFRLEVLPLMAGALPGGAFLRAQRLTVQPSWCTAPMCFNRFSG